MMRCLFFFVLALFAFYQGNARPVPVAVKHFQGLVEHPMNLVSPLSLLQPIITPQLVYHENGPVITQAKIKIILWGNGTYIPEVTNNVLPQWFSDIVNSPFVAWWSEYFQRINGQTTNIGLAVYQERVTINPSYNGVLVTDTLIQEELEWQIEHGFLTADESTVFMIYFPAEITVINELPVLGVSCVTFCGYHGSFDIVDNTGLLGALLGGGTRLNIKYGVIPDLTPALCRLGCGTGSVFEQTVQVTSHELAEIITDPRVVELGEMAWYDTINGEAADICLGEAPGSIQIQGSGGAVRTWSVQKIWSNGDSKCIVSKDFAIGLSSSNGIIVRNGQPGVAVIILTQLGGSNQAVDFTISSSLRPGMTYSFSSNDFNNGPTTLSISANLLTTPGSINIQVTATGAVHTRQLTIPFVVVSA